MAARNRKFSFYRLITNAVPNFAHDDINDVDLTPTQADDLVAYQLTFPNALYLTKDSFYIAGITDSKGLSHQVHKALLKTGIIAPCPSLTDTSSEASSLPSLAPVNTSAITRSFANKLACISVHAQRKLVGMLFFWEEEVTRFTLLDIEEAEIVNAIQQAGGQNPDLEVALKAVRMRRTMVPSRRGEATANISTGVGHQLPPYN